MGRIVWIGMFALGAIAAACGSSSSSHPDAHAIDAPVSTCGQPGDVGNELGIGHYCTAFSDCSATVNAPLCSILGDPTTHFCTTTCTMGSNATCGTGAVCTCNASNQCGCTPSACLN